VPASRYGPAVPKSAAPKSVVPQPPAQLLLRNTRIMLAIQVPTAILAGALIFWQFGLSPHSHHDLALASILTGAYAVLAVAGIAVIQWSWRSRARRLGASQANSVG
jgi:protein-S-isoprenylcysteine O-methyltransferase Ste14